MVAQNWIKGLYMTEAIRISTDIQSLNVMK